MTKAGFTILSSGVVDVLGGLCLHIHKIAHSATVKATARMTTTYVVASLVFALLPPPLSARDAALGATVWPPVGAVGVTVVPCVRPGGEVMSVLGAGEFGFKGAGMAGITAEGFDVGGRVDSGVGGSIDDSVGGGVGGGVGDGVAGEDIGGGCAVSWVGGWVGKGGVGVGGEVGGGVGGGGVVGGGVGGGVG